MGVLDLRSDPGVPRVSMTSPRRGARVAILSTAIGVPVIGLGIAAVGIVPLLTASPTEVSDTASEGPLGVAAFESLSVETVNRVGFEQDNVWVVPVDADWSSFPTTSTSPYGSCTVEQLAWLNVQGEELISSSEFGFSNTANEGSSLSIYDIRLEGQVGASAPSIEVHCRSRGGGMGGVEMVVSTLGTASDLAAVVQGVEGIEGADVHYVIGEQVAFNLRPGDQARLSLGWSGPDPGQTFRGAVMASITSGNQEARVALPTSDGEGLVLATASITGSRIDINEGMPFCYDGGDEAFADILDQFPGGCDATPALVGTWSGQVEGDRHPYSLEVTIGEQNGILTAVADYPEIPCTATWVQTARRSTSVQFLERVGTEYACYDQVPVMIEMVDRGVSGITLNYSAPSGGYQLSAELWREH